MWFSGELRGRKNDICSSAVSHEQNKSQPSPSCKVSKFRRRTKEQSEKKNLYLNRCFYRAEARTALQTPGLDLTSWCSVKYLLEVVPSCTWPAVSAEIKSQGEGGKPWGCLSAGSDGPCCLQPRMNLIVFVQKDVNTSISKNVQLKQMDKSK